MNSLPDQPQEEHGLVGVTCGHLVAVPAIQLPEFYRGQRWGASVCVCFLVLCIAIAGACDLLIAEAPSRPVSVETGAMPVPPQSLTVERTQ